MLTHSKQAKLQVIAHPLPNTRSLPHDSLLVGQLRNPAPLTNFATLSLVFTESSRFGLLIQRLIHLRATFCLSFVLNWPQPEVDGAV